MKTARKKALPSDLVINGNYGNHTIALIQWAHEQKLKNHHQVIVVSIDTGFAANGWEARVLEGEALATSYGFLTHRIQNKFNFQTQVLDRREFPSQKFQWCASFLKGLPILEWLDEQDPALTATIILGKRKRDSRINQNLPEYVFASPHYGERKVWHPLINVDDPDFYALIQRAGFKSLDHRSLECDPCIHNRASDFIRMDSADIIKTEILESAINRSMFQYPMQKMLNNIQKQGQPIEPYKAEVFDLGCGSPFGCGE